MALTCPVQRNVITVNGIVPGPTIEVYEGTEVVVTIVNNLENEATTIHFHGMYQRGTPWMDGVSSVSQCAVLPSSSFTYRFIAEVCAVAVVAVVASLVVVVGCCLHRASLTARCFR